jgi:hypothetical protein
MNCEYKAKKLIMFLKTEKKKKKISYYKTLILIELVLNLKSINFCITNFRSPIPEKTSDSQCKSIQ